MVGLRSNTCISDGKFCRTCPLNFNSALISDPTVPILSVIRLQMRSITPIRTILIICCCVKDFHKFSGFKQPQFISQQFCQWEVQPPVFGWILCSACYKAEVKVPSGLNSQMETLGKNLPNSFLLAKFSSLQLWDWGSCLLAESHSGPALRSWKSLYSFHLASSMFKPATLHQILLVPWISEFFSLWVLDPDLKGHVIGSGPAR